MCCTTGQVPHQQLHLHSRGYDRRLGAYSAPYIHLQILRPKDDEQRDKAIAYFKEHQKQYITLADRKEILLYLGTTQEAYIKSSVAPVEINELKNLLPQAAHWYRFYGNNKDS